MPEQVREQMAFHTAESIDQVLGWALEPAAGQSDSTPDVEAA